MGGGEADLNPEALWLNLRSRLSRLPDGTDPQTDVAAAAGLFDLLSNAERSALARYMCDELRAGLRESNPLSPLQHAVLGLVDPYITNSDLQGEARILLSNALSTSGRSFEDEFAIAHGLIDLSYRVPGSDDLWLDFYARHSRSEKTRHDALDLALAGLAPWNLVRFKELVTDYPAERWLVDRIDMFLPTLTRNFKPAQVGDLLQSLYDRCADLEERARLRLLAQAYALSLATELHSRPAQLVPDSAIPEPLRLARTLVWSEKRSDPEGTQRALDRPKIHVYRSRYAGEDSVYRFQQDVLEKLRGLAGDEKRVTSSESDDFSELYSPMSLNRKVAFAFPTYLTASKRSLGYSCASFGRQRRIGILLPYAHRLYSSQQRPDALEEMLHEVMRDGGKVYCPRNYAISEIVWQIVNKDEELESYFDDRKVRICDRRGSLPVIPDTDTRNFIFLFDLSQQADLERLARRPSARGTRPRNKTIGSWIKRAKLATLSHAELIEVGVVFSKYMIDWLSENGRWGDIEAFVAAQATRPDFARALKALGVDINESPPPASLETPQNSGLRIVKH